MQRVIIDIHSYVLGEAVELALKANGDFQVTVCENPRDTVSKCYNLAATAVLIEVTENRPWGFEERLEQCSAIKQNCPDCKIAFLVDEVSKKELAEKVKQAKKDKLIDEFIYSSTSASYLAAVIDSM